MVIGRFTLVSPIVAKRGAVKWRLRCFCGTEALRYGSFLEGALKKSKFLSCGCFRREKKVIVAVGDRYGRLVVLSKVEDNSEGGSWRCRCDCGRESIPFAGNLIRGGTRSCGVCVRLEHGLKLRKDFNGIPPSFIRRLSGGLTADAIWQLYLRQDRKCALTGLEIWLPKPRTKSRGTASLDRIDSGVGYVPGNVQWVHKDVNRMKNAYPQQWFIEICRMVAQAHPPPNSRTQT